MENTTNHHCFFYNRLDRENIPILPFWTLEHIEDSVSSPLSLLRVWFLYLPAFYRDFLGSFPRSSTLTLGGEKTL